jgi:hypothetical protein
VHGSQLLHWCRVGIKVGIKQTNIKVGIKLCLLSRHGSGSGCCRCLCLGKNQIVAIVGSRYKIGILATVALVGWCFI